ncbi:MAG: DUF58 domain-containing protein [Gammaproteobacteria bacterium]|nr:DUF58 domain-containing protein [Gammaproteobacteria bacterium]
MYPNQSDHNDGLIFISQSKLIGLQREAGLLKQQPGKIISRLSGNYLSSFKGRGMEFDEARPYQPGDDIRNMDWRVTARTNKPYSKMFREERERPILLWVDFRASMFFGTKQCFKSVLASKVAALLAWKGSQQGDRLGGLFFSDQVHRELRPARGKSATLHLIKQLSEFSQQNPSMTSLTAQSENKAGHALRRLAHVAHPGSLIYMISDFRHIPRQLESTLNRLSRHNELVLLHVYDPLETELPPNGFYRVTDGQSETDINTSVQSKRDQYRDRFVKHRQALVQLCKKNKVRFLTISTHQPLLQTLMQGNKPFSQEKSNESSG